MNCLTEALGLSLPGNGSTLATAKRRRDLFVQAGHTVVNLAKRYYDDGDESLPRAIATRSAFRCSNDYGHRDGRIHEHGAAHPRCRAGGRGGFSLDDIDELSRKTLCLSKVAPNSTRFHMEDFQRAGGILALLGELRRAGLLDTSVHSIHAVSMEEWLDAWDIRGKARPEAFDLFSVAPGECSTTEPFSQDNR